MGHDLRGDRVDSFLSSDLQPQLLDACATVLTRTTSDSSSSITVENNSFHDFEHRSPFPLTRWTNQQHTLYLNSLEASFVNELHRSIRLRGSLQNNIDKAPTSRTLQNLPKMPRQKSLVIQDGFRKISHEKIEHMLESTADSHVLAESQLGVTSVERGSSLTDPNAYEDGLLCDEGIHGKGISTFSKMSRRTLEKQTNRQSFHFQLVGSTTEVKDQSFKNEEARSSCKPMAKRLKTAAAAAASSNDQVVPFGNFHTMDVSTSTNSNSENKGDKLLSELPESFHFRKSDLPCFLRGRC
ncbi:PREDICTED: uncharacterized protein LOC109331405 isoform X2 [Lupinus angustifolius]|uniref:uncharacterized protein LOC109331405 isoform X2 n=1 Tax=Lupinus angustifolius TaxID=3871 RepID=UPI00092F6667|nr:PREDICTED: uncharacterized protein LOC109331405 isoform X2 [Lupinus angustifolius]